MKVKRKFIQLSWSLQVQLETLEKSKNCPKYHVKSFDYKLLFGKWTKEEINHSPPGNNEKRAIKNSEWQIQELITWIRRQIISPLFCAL